MAAYNSIHYIKMGLKTQDERLVTIPCMKSLLMRREWALRGCIAPSLHPQGLSCLHGEGSALRPSGEKGEGGRAPAHMERGYSMPAKFT